MNLRLVGLSYKTAPVEVRERLAIPEEKLPDALRTLTSIPGVSEAFILSTCNRVEILSRDESPDPNSNHHVERFLADFHGVDFAEIEKFIYRFHHRDAIRHIFRVAGSLDSMIVGEAQILGQVKAAYAKARATGTLGGTLDEVLSRSFAVAKRIRTETGIASSAVSVGYAAVELAKKIFGSLDGKSVMVVGAGKMSLLAAKHLRSSGASNIFVTNRTPQRAAEMAEALGGKPVPFERFLEHASKCDIVLSSTGSPAFIIRKQDVQRLIGERRNRPMFFIDIAVPRDIDPAVNDLDNVFLYDIDDLQKVVDGNLKDRLREAKRGEEIAEHEVEKLLGRLKTLDVVPTIVELQNHMEQIRQAEMHRLQSHLKNLTPEQQEAVEMLTKGMINKILHPPISHLKHSAQENDGLMVVDIVRKIFNLKD